MTRITRRHFLQASAAAGAAIGAPMLARESLAQELSFKPEPGAKLRVLRWKRSVQGDEDQWLANTKKFSSRAMRTFEIIFIIAPRVDCRWWYCW